MKYRDYVPRLAHEFESELGKIASVYNFDLGDEFEISLCQVFRRILPERYGICRGHVTTEAGEQAGDDIIIFDRLRYPTILGRTRDDFSRKEWVPIEAVYAYVEAKHTLEIEGDGPSSLAHAAEQAARVKRLVGTRQPVPMSQIRPNLDFSMGGMFQFTAVPGFPDHLNPSFAAVFSRQLRKEPKGPLLVDREEITRLLYGHKLPDDGCPDLVVGGPNLIVLPALVDSSSPTHGNIASPFYIPGVSRSIMRTPDGLALGLGLCTLMGALDFIQLGGMPWGSVVGEGL